MANNHIIITEYEFVTRGKKSDDVKFLSENSFDALEKFVLENTDKNAEALLGLSIKKNSGKVITAKNNVGVIGLKDGTVIEILPKIYSKPNDEEGIKRVFIRMLNSLGNMPYINIQTTSLDTSHMNIFEFFINIFVKEVGGIVKKGLKCDYESISSNENFFKGKMLFDKQIKYNFAHKERNFVQYDEYSLNRTENRIIKAALNYLYKVSIDQKNKKGIRRLLAFFDDVDESTDYKHDFSTLAKDITAADYENALVWSKVFLLHESFTPFEGSEVAYALLFPMERVFESYIAKLVRRNIDGDKYSVSVQDKKYYLFDKPKAFQIQPDIVVENNNGGGVFVLDTKWKRLESDKNNYGISQDDMYQMYAYQKKYNARSVTLIYPKTDEAIEPPDYIAEDNAVRIHIRFVDLFDDENASIKNIMTGILSAENANNRN